MKLGDDKLGDLEEIANYIGSDRVVVTRQLFLVDNIDGLSSEVNKDALYAGIAANIARQIDDHNAAVQYEKDSVKSEYRLILDKLLDSVSKKSNYLK